MPVVIILAAAFVSFYNSDLNVFWKAIMLFLFVALQDIGFKLLAPGKHDLELLGWIMGMQILGLIPAFIMLLIKTLMTKEASALTKAGSLLLFLSLIFLYSWVFFKLGIA